MKQTNELERENKRHVVKLYGINIELPRPQLPPQSTHRTSIVIWQFI